MLGHIVRRICFSQCTLANLHSHVDSHTVSKRMKSLPILGAAHGSDLLNIFGDGELTDYLIHFATNLDPNCGLSPEWPRYTTSSPQLMTFLDGQTANRTITLDTYRVEGMEFITNLSLASPL
jgi:acetylcholinesterase